MQTNLEMIVSIVFLYVFGSFCSFAFLICFNDFSTHTRIRLIAKVLFSTKILDRWGFCSLGIVRIFLLKFIQKTFGYDYFHIKRPSSANSPYHTINEFSLSTFYAWICPNLTTSTCHKYILTRQSILSHSVLMDCHKIQQWISVSN